jgi:hypothetical protein
MSKFCKRILSANKNQRNCLVVGSGLGYIDEILEHFNTVFLIFNETCRVRKSNIVRRENFELLDTLTDIDFVFVDEKYFSDFKKLRPVWLRCRPVFLLEGEDLFGLENYKYFRSENYALVEKYKNMQKWIPQ